jgi:hypothetical protein
MAEGQDKIGPLAAQLMNDIDENYPTDAAITAVGFVVEVTPPDGEAEIVARFSETRVALNVGMLTLAVRHMGG